ncbi:hypothetical protein PMG11_04098 [Penicillium brasilianum]|uniref:Uncharacterized protein n=1 Tax=Penicillium brasilianum TaxID=104259 RepID=A0A0F7VBR4_PENBI|nr:hypothetical protein PMG11_04098 [Penicillium brasilianum]
MPPLSAIHSHAPAAFNWLDAMSVDKSFFDPRTSDLHRFPLPARGPSYPMDDLDITSPVLVAPTPIKPSVTTWTHNSMKAWETEGFEPLPADDIELDADVNDDNDSLAGIELEQLQLEAVPPYPNRFAGDSLLSLHDQIQSPRKQHYTFSRLPIQQTETHPRSQPEEPILYHPILIDPVLEPYAYAFSDSASSMASSSEEKTQNVGKLIANKARKAAAHGAATYRILRKKLSF